MNAPDTSLSPLWTRLSSEVNKTGTWRAALPHWRDQPSPCLGACPVSGRIATWIGQARNGDLRAAWDTLVDNNPFPAIAGRICHHPCEAACNRAEWDETVSICALERFVGDTALAEGWGFSPPATERAARVAVVGGGPAGLSAAYQLRRAGIQVTLIEARDALGGLMRHGIPSYRLAREVLDAEIARITDMGLDLRLGAGLMDRAALEALAQDHDAVFLATGASLPKRLPGLDYSAGFVTDSADFLAADAPAQARLAGGHVLVVGGGSAAMDVARTARRLGRAVTVLTLEPEGALPAQPEEVTEATEEGVRFVTGAMLRAARPDGARVSAECVRVDFTPGAVRGQFSVTPIADSDFVLEVDTIIPAIGQDADVARWQGLLTPAGPVLATRPDSLATDHPRIFAGGDVASMDRFVTHAIGMGKQAARAILRSLAPDAPLPESMAGPVVEYARINTAYQVEAPRQRPQHAPVATRLRGFDEVQAPLDAAAARAEAARCFSCGSCIQCDNCLYYCPDVAVNRLGPGYAVRLDYCKGCGLCVAECPTGAVHMVEEADPDPGAADSTEVRP